MLEPNRDLRNMRKSSSQKATKMQKACEQHLVDRSFEHTQLRPYNMSISVKHAPVFGSMNFVSSTLVFSARISLPEMATDRTLHFHVDV